MNKDQGIALERAVSFVEREIIKEDKKSLSEKKKFEEEETKKLLAQKICGIPIEDKDGLIDKTSQMTALKVRNEYNKLFNEFELYKKKYMCHNCGRMTVRSEFLSSSKTATGLIPICSTCLNKIANGYNPSDGTSKETFETFLSAAKKADFVLYKNKIVDAINSYNDKNTRHKSIWDAYVIIICCPSYGIYGFDDSDREFLSINSKKLTFQNILEGEYTIVSGLEYLDETELKDKIVDKIEKSKKFFGFGLPDEAYIYCQNEYDDWVSRHECKTKAQEEIFKRICLKQWEILQATRRSESTKDLDATYQNLLSTGNLQPKQNSNDAISEAQTFGTLIQKWEENEPIPEVDEQFKDIDKIGLYIDVFFRGHLAKVLKLKNAFSNLYDGVMKKYTVEKPNYNEETDQEDLFNHIFGSSDQDEE